MYNSEGLNSGKTQVFLTPGIVFGRFPIHDRFGFTIGTGALPHLRPQIRPDDRLPVLKLAC
jgi:hypothetical protein